MVARASLSSSTLDNSAAAIRLLADRGYESTTAEDLAEAFGMSRSTFFRRFGSKDDVMFADHDHALASLEARLEEALTHVPPQVAEELAGSTADVLRLLTRDPEAAQLRLELMRRTPSLRDRELIITHRYQRVFERFLRRALPSTTPSWVIPSVGAGVVAIHNRTLRDWLHGSITDAPATLTRDLGSFTSGFTQWLAPGAAPTQRVLVAVYDATATPEHVLEAVTAELSHDRLK